MQLWKSSGVKPDISSYAALKKELAIRDANETKTVRVLDQLARSMVLTRMVPFHYLNNQTKLTTKAGDAVSVVVRCVGGWLGGMYVRAGRLGWLYTALHG